MGTATFKVTENMCDVPTNIHLQLSEVDSGVIHIQTRLIDVHDAN